MLGSARPRPLPIGLLALAATSAIVLSACGGGGGDDGSASSDDEVVIGFALSQSGAMAPFDQEPGRAAMLRIDQINADGGIGGRQIRTIERDVRSSPETVGTATTELIAEGAQLIVTPCDFDLSAPGAAIAQSSEVPAVSICAGDPKMADTKTLGDYVFSANTGSDVEGATGASWAFGNGWQTAYLLQDESIEYTKSAGGYFEAAFEQLGGSIVGEDAFPGGDNVNISSQVNRLRNLDDQPDFVYVASWNPGGATAIRQLREAGIDLPVVGPAALDGQILLDTVGGTASGIYYTGFACYVYCTGAESAGLDEFVADYEEANSAAPSSSYALLGYNMVNAIAAGFESAGGGGGAELRDALTELGPVETPIGDVDYFSATCHKITAMPLTVIQVDAGKMTFVEQARAESLPDLGDGNSCAG